MFENLHADKTYRKVVSLTSDSEKKKTTCKQSKMKAQIKEKVAVSVT